MGSSTTSRSIPVKFVNQVNIDDDGRALHYPSTLFYDPVEQEIYLVNGGTSRVVVYGADLFPQVSIGSGRGIHAPRGVHVTREGLVYISQTRSATNPSPRITILNGAFFMVREILLDDIPEAADFAPSNLAVSTEGLIYLTGTSNRGVLVLDNEGNFLRRLQPMDVITDQAAIAAPTPQEGIEEEQPPATAERGFPVDIPEEFRPRSRNQGSAGSGPGMGPVRINNVIIDNGGNLFLISAETSKIYVYSADETFLFTFGSKGGTPGRLSQPRSLAVDDKRKLIYVVDYMRHTVLAYDFEGRLRFEFGGRGTGPGWFNFPVDIALNRQGQIIVADLFNRRVQVLELEYLPAFSVSQGEQASTPAGKRAVASGKQEAETDPDTATSNRLHEGVVSEEEDHDRYPEAEIVEEPLPQGKQE